MTVLLAVFGDRRGQLPERLHLPAAARQVGGVAGRRQCPACGLALAWFENVPVLAIWCSGAAAGRAGRAISLSYPLVELATAGVFVADVA